jgi:Ni/Fe-hydrogenase subunit HybB-like protein
MAQLSYGKIDNNVLRATGRPILLYFFVLLILGGGIMTAAGLWLYQTKVGLGVANIHQPVDWGVYIANFVYWIGIAHSGTLISAILFLVRAKWRDSVSRATEAMTIFAIATAGLFPMVHLGRFWVIYYMLPYPSERHIWPNFTSPLIWDILAVSTYLTVSLIFFYFGLIPDVASFRDKCEMSLGLNHWKTRLYQILASGWSGAGGAWRHYGRSYLYFAALATPLVISVHSIVSWDFAMSLLTGWHNTLFAPYFVAGAIHSGLAMALVLLVPMRRLLNLKQIIKIEHLEAVAKTMLVTTAIIAYSYAIEPFMAWYSGDRFEIQFMTWQVTGWTAPIYWSLFFFNVLAPLSFIFKSVRSNVRSLFAIGILVNIGMWLERVMIVTAATSHDFMPHNWTSYFPSPIEIMITIGSFCFFFFFYLVFAKLLPTVPTADLKGRIGEMQMEGIIVQERPAAKIKKVSRGLPAVTGIYNNAGSLFKAVKKAVDAEFQKLEFFSPVKLPQLERLLGYEKSPVRFWTLAGALSGLIGGFWLAIGTANVNALIVGGKQPVSLIPFCIVGFEGLILMGSLANLFGFFVHTRSFHRKNMPYDRRYSQDTFALKVSCDTCELEKLKHIMAETNPEEMHVDN